MLRVANLILYSLRGVPSLLDLSVTVKGSCSVVSFSGGASDYQQSQSHRRVAWLRCLLGGAAPPECGTEPLQVHGRAQYPSPANNRTIQSLRAFITLNASERAQS